MGPGKSSGFILSNGKAAKDFSYADVDWKEEKVETGISVRKLLRSHRPEWGRAAKEVRKSYLRQTLVAGSTGPT